ncbi:MAG: hypothetical protein ACYDBJ_15220 [Aggregatilineales bacterium]
MLPPKPSPKREIGVNTRFNAIEYERLKQIATYRGISVTTLLHYVISNAIIPRLEREIQKEKDSEQDPISSSPHGEVSPETHDWPKISLDA